MPCQFNADRRNKFPSQRHRVTNWDEYKESLRRRSELTVRISEGALGQWPAPRRTTRGKQPVLSDKCEPVSVLQQPQSVIPRQADATRQERRRGSA